MHELPRKAYNRPLDTISTVQMQWETLQMTLGNLQMPIGLCGFHIGAVQVC